MAYAVKSDVVSALGRNLSTSEDESVTTLLEEAADLLTGFLGCEPDPAPDAVKRVNARMVARVFAQASATDAPIVGASQVQQTVGPFSKSMSFASGTSMGAPWLTGADKTAVKAFRCGGGFKAVSLESEQSGRYRSYVRDLP